jgi:nucleoside-diphosphate-sugar epimerase
LHVLVTGAGGFVGRHLIEALLAKGHRVTGTFRRAPPSSELAGRRAGLELVARDLAEPARLPERIDGVIHAAATSAWTGITVDRIARDNVEGTRRLVEYALGAGARGFIYLSSMSVYGEIEADEVDEDTPIRNPDAYGATKYVGELLVGDAAKRLPGLAIRLPGVIGPGARRNFLAEALAKIQEGAEVRVFNPDARFNNAVHVGELAAFAADLLAKGWTGYDKVVVGAAGHTTVEGAVRRMITRRRSHSAVAVGSAKKGSFTVCSRKASRLYGYAPMEIGAMLDRFADEGV